MEKILVAFNETRFSNGAFEFARQLNKRQPALLTGVFLPEPSYQYIRKFEEETAGIYKDFIEKEEEIAADNIEQFRSLCKKSGIDFRIHHGFLKSIIQELKRETKFADLLIISSEKFYDALGINDPDISLEDALHTAQCPVIVVPELYQFPEKNILLYDGSESSVYAIKQFAYLLPELCSNETILVFLNEEENATIPDEDEIKELAAQHYTNLEILKLKMEPEKYFSTWVNEHKNAIIISGSYGRSVLSLLLKKSFVTDLIVEHKLPVFIAHK